MTEEVKEKKETFSLEEGLEKIERLLERLTDREVTLEESFRLYQEGMELLKLREWVMHSFQYLRHCFFIHGKRCFQHFPGDFHNLFYLPMLSRSRTL